MSVDETTVQPTTPTSYPVSLVVVDTGREHGVDGGARFDLIRDEQGNPETEYALVATIDGVNVPLQTFSRSALDQLAASEKARTAPQPSG